ncbi:AAA family ATPase [Vagococcus acidifermentans]|uniref:AAA family ATPase n=1 Tax=Vagococcus acidifermentans TaxID=564710 RepID=A0A430ANT3_9ENTE|nr:AAA family ATPase [Vagococcus acidifermentans]RSU09798.1 hypothetical protein CBF27_11985 [Vagococcus acidifermentans]
MKAILICGIHGVGKSSFIKNNAQFNSYAKYSCSQLIKNYSGLEFKDKKTTNVDGNQNILLKAVQYFVKEKHVLYDGHITLFNKNRSIETIDPSVFKSLNIEHFIMLKAPPTVIYERILKRDGTTWLTIDIIEKAQENEEKKVVEYSKKMDVTYEIFCWNEQLSDWEK